jgi:hypothetical protein
MAPGADWDADFRWTVPDSPAVPDGAVSILGEWACCEDPSHDPVQGWFILTPVPGCTWADLINQMAQNGIKVLSLVTLPHYMPEELRR